MPEDADPAVFDDLWYFDSVVRKPLKRGKSRAKQTAAAAEGDTASEGESQLPVSTGGEQGANIHVPNAVSCSEDGGDAQEGQETGCESCKKSSNDGRGIRRGGTPSMCELVDKMEKGTGELPAKELNLWMQKLGLEYTTDGAMIRRTQPASADRQDQQQSSQQKLMDFSEFVCINRFIEDERYSSQEADSSSFDSSDAHMASLYEIFHLFDRDDNGLISPSELRAALAKLGLCRNGRSAGSG
ncbi:hypothetical protein L7F22_008829 [Adiantum nelumboides]|nr:hypothetical protein [Adiantum nelumboides]